MKCLGIYDKSPGSGRSAGQLGVRAAIFGPRAPKSTAAREGFAFARSAQAEEGLVNQENIQQVHHRPFRSQIEPPCSFRSRVWAPTLSPLPVSEFDIRYRDKKHSESRPSWFSKSHLRGDWASGSLHLPGIGQRGSSGPSMSFFMAPTTAQIQHQCCATM